MAIFLITNFRFKEKEILRILLNPENIHGLKLFLDLRKKMTNFLMLEIIFYMM